MLSIPSLQVLQRMETLDAIDMLDEIIVNTKKTIMEHKVENRRQFFYRLYEILLLQDRYLNLRIDDE